MRGCLFCEISIHALLTESDAGKHVQPPRQPNFYPRSPYGERLEKVPADVYYQAFLSTLSLRRATPAKSESLTTYLDFYPRSPYGERRYRNRRNKNLLLFLSTLSLRRATGWTLNINGPMTFLSTLSLRRATCVKRFQAADISDFYPRSPYGERQ